MRRRHLFTRLLALAFAFILLAPSLAAAQDASPVATPENGLPVASPVGSGQHFVVQNA